MNAIEINPVTKLLSVIGLALILLVPTALGDAAQVSWAAPTPAAG